MKAKQLLLSVSLLLTAVTAWADVEINTSNFPDNNFRNFLLGQTYGTDGVLTDSEIAGITSLNLMDKYIESLKGIEYLTALTSLQCQRNKLTQLDVSKNTALVSLNCPDNQLTSLNVKGCAALTALTCTGNQLTTLDVSGCTVLTNLVCYGNRIKGMGMNTLVASLPHVSNGTMLVLYIQDEQNMMTKSQVAAAKAKGWTPKWLDTNTWAWSEYEGSEDPDPVDGLEINATNFPDDNFRSWLYEQEYGTDGVLTDEEIAGIQSISVFNKGIRSLKGIELFTALTELDCSVNDLGSLDVSECTGLTSLICQACGLTSLDVSKNFSLGRLICTGNQLTSLDVSNHFSLTTLTCDLNQLTTLNVSGCFALSTLSYTSNRIKGAGMDSLVESLPKLGEGNTRWMYVIGSSEDEQNEMTRAQVSAAEAKGWYPARWAGYNQSGWDIWEEYLGIDADTVPSTDLAIDETNFPDERFRNFLLGQTYGADGMLSESEIAGITTLNLNDRYIESLKGIEYLTVLTSLQCQRNKLSELDISKNTALTSLNCSDNQLTSLNVSGCAALTALTCSFNQLTVLDVSGCTALTNLSCYHNSINGAGMDALVASLPTVSSGTMLVIGSQNEQNDMTREQVAVVKAKGWIPKWFDPNYDWREYEGSGEVIPDFATLFYCTSGQSIMRMTVKTGDVTLSITPEVNWTVDTLMVNGVDKRSMLANDELTISVKGMTEVRVSYRWANDENLYTEDYETGIATIASEKVKVFSLDGQLCIDGAVGRQVRLYTVGGALVKTVVPQASDKIGIFSVPAGTYIVQVGNKAAKVSVR